MIEERKREGEPSGWMDPAPRPGVADTAFGPEGILGMSWKGEMSPLAQAWATVRKAVEGTPREVPCIRIVGRKGCGARLIASILVDACRHQMFPPGDAAVVSAGPHRLRSVHSALHEIGAAYRDQVWGGMTRTEQRARPAVAVFDESQVKHLPYGWVREIGLQGLEMDGCGRRVVVVIVDEHPAGRKDGTTHQSSEVQVPVEPLEPGVLGEMWRRCRGPLEGQALMHLHSLSAGLTGDVFGAEAFASAEDPDGGRRSRSDPEWIRWVADQLGPAMVRDLEDAEVGLCGSERGWVEDLLEEDLSEEEAVERAARWGLARIPDRVETWNKAVGAGIVKKVGGRIVPGDVRMVIAQRIRAGRDVVFRESWLEKPEMTKAEEKVA